MFFHIDPDNGVPVYEQVVRQVTFAVAGGALCPGDRVPSVRLLARELAINPNTVARAYRQLQDAQTLEAVRGTGLHVADGATARCRAERKRILRERFRQVIDEARLSQITDKDIVKLFEAELRAVRASAVAAPGQVRTDQGGS